MPVQRSSNYRGFFIATSVGRFRGHPFDAAFVITRISSGMEEMVCCRRVQGPIASGDDGGMAATREAHAWVDAYIARQEAIAVATSAWQRRGSNASPSD